MGTPIVGETQVMTAACAWNAIKPQSKATGANLLIVGTTQGKYGNGCFNNNNDATIKILDAAILASRKSTGVAKSQKTLVSGVNKLKHAPGVFQNNLALLPKMNLASWG